MGRKIILKEFKGVWIPYEILTDIKLNDKENSREIALRKITPIYKNVNTYKKINTSPINTNVKEIINNNKYKSDRDYSNFDWTSLYANNF